MYFYMSFFIRMPIVGIYVSHPALHLLVACVLLYHMSSNITLMLNGVKNVAFFYN